MPDTQKFEISLHQAIFAGVAVYGVEHRVETYFLAVHRHGKIIHIHRIFLIQFIYVIPAVPGYVHGIDIVFFLIQIAAHYPARFERNEPFGGISSHYHCYVLFHFRPVFLHLTVVTNGKVMFLTVKT